MNESKKSEPSCLGMIAQLVVWLFIGTLIAFSIVMSIEVFRALHTCGEHCVLVAMPIVSTALAK